MYYNFFKVILSSLDQALPGWITHSIVRPPMDGWWMDWRDIWSEWSTSSILEVKFCLNIRNVTRLDSGCPLQRIWSFQRALCTIELWGILEKNFIFEKNKIRWF